LIQTKLYKPKSYLIKFDALEQFVLHDVTVLVPDGVSTSAGDVTFARSDHLNNNNIKIKIINEKQIKIEARYLPYVNQHISMFLKQCIKKMMF
jgi:hypothetical protein